MMYRVIFFLIVFFRFIRIFVADSIQFLWFWKSLYRCGICLYVASFGVMCLWAPDTRRWFKRGPTLHVAAVILLHFFFPVVSVLCVLESSSLFFNAAIGIWFIDFYFSLLLDSDIVTWCHTQTNVHIAPASLILCLDTGRNYSSDASKSNRQKYFWPEACFHSLSHR